MIEKAGLKIVGLRLVQLSDAQARAFYAVHKERPFFPDLVRFMTSGPAVVMAIEGENAVDALPRGDGPDRLKKAPAGTIRNKYGTNIERNAVHGSDAPRHGQGRAGLLLRRLGPRPEPIRRVVSDCIKYLSLPPTQI